MNHHFKIIVLIPLIAFTLSSCTAPPKFSRISIGYTKHQVIAALGEPKRTSANGHVERLSYEWDDPADGRVYGKWAHVQFVDGRVVAYGVDDAPSSGYNLGAAMAASAQSMERQQSIDAYNARSEALRAPVNVNLQGTVNHNVSGTVYHR